MRERGRGKEERECREASPSCWLLLLSTFPHLTPALSSLTHTHNQHTHANASTPLHTPTHKQSEQYPRVQQQHQQNQKNRTFPPFTARQHA